MRQPISVLEKHVIDQIAAGEVVEHPASVVKELIENAIDASATAITVESKEGGKSYLRVTDNGIGIPEEELRKAFTRHATSKIQSLSDLQQLTSFGFRGEALSSIASVSRLRCITKTSDALSGICLDLEAGTEVSFSEMGTPDGTTIFVRDLFFNTPARSKFLDSTTKENSRLRKVVEEAAFSRPDIAFTYIADGKTLLWTSGKDDLPDLIYRIYGRDTASHLYAFRQEQNGLVLHGFLGAPQIARGNRQGELFFVNHRPIHSILLQKAAEEGYHGYLMQHRFPFLVMYLQLSGDQVDVNVHPAKREVRFRDEKVVAELVRKTISDRMHTEETIPDFSLERTSSLTPQPAKKETFSAPMSRPAEPFERKRIEQTSLWQTQKEPASVLREDPVFYGKREVLTEEARPRHRLLGQVFDTYWLMTYQDQLYIVDQHAAHEKVLFEEMMQAYQTQKIVSQQIFPSVVIEPGAGEAALIREQLDVFQSLGYEIEPFGGEAFKLSALPANLHALDPQTLFTDLLADWHTEKGVPTISMEERLASASCKAAVKGNNHLSMAEADALLDALLRLENPYHCPHGRPTMIALSREELDKRFKRII